MVPAVHKCRQLYLKLGSVELGQGGPLPRQQPWFAAASPTPCQALAAGEGLCLLGNSTELPAAIACWLTPFQFLRQATGLREERRRRSGAGMVKMGPLLRAIEWQARKSCDTDIGGCCALTLCTMPAYPEAM